MKQCYDGGHVFPKVALRKDICKKCGAKKSVKEVMIPEGVIRGIEDAFNGNFATKEELEEALKL